MQAACNRSVPCMSWTRGYSLTRTAPEGRLVHSVRQVRAGDALEILVSDGRIRARTETVQPEPTS